MRHREVRARVERELVASDLDALLVTGSDHLRYLGGGVAFPDEPAVGALLWPAGGEPVVVAEPGVVAALAAGGAGLETYDCAAGIDADGLAARVAAVAGDRLAAGASVGIDERRTPAALHEALARALAPRALVPADRWLAGLRAVKTAAEVAHLVDLAARADHALNGAAHHVLVTAVGSEMGEAESIRVHALERGLEVAGHRAIAGVAAGPAAAAPWPHAPRFGVGSARHPRPGEWVRLSLAATREGYWASATRLLHLGEMDAARRAEYAGLVALREAAAAAIAPGARACDVHAAMVARAGDRGIAPIPGRALGHGVGVSPLEPPFLDPGDPTELAAGMVLVVAPAVRAADGTWLEARDTFVVTPDGARLVGWYKDWREPFVANHSY